MARCNTGITDLKANGSNCDGLSAMLCSSLLVYPCWAGNKPVYVNLAPEL